MINTNHLSTPIFLPQTSKARECGSLAKVIIANSVKLTSKTLPWLVLNKELWTTNSKACLMWDTFTSFSSFQLSQHFPKSNKTTWNLHNIHKLQSSPQFSWRKPSAVILIPFSFALPLFTSLFVLMAAHPSTFHSLVSQSQHWPCHSALGDWRTLGLPVHLCPLGSLVRSLMGYYCDFLQVYNQFTNNKSLLQYILAQGKLRTKWARWWDLLLWTATHTTNNFVFVSFFSFNRPVTVLLMFPQSKRLATCRKIKMNHF